MVYFRKKCMLTFLIAVSLILSYFCLLAKDDTQMVSAKRKKKKELADFWPVKALKASRAEQRLSRLERLENLKVQVKKLRQHSLTTKRQLRVKGQWDEFPLFESRHESRAERGEFFKSKCLSEGQAFRWQDCVTQNQLNYRKNRVNRLCQHDHSIKNSNNSVIKAERLFVLQSR